jgi:hypothetical protein
MVESIAGGILPICLASIATAIALSACSTQHINADRANTAGEATITAESKAWSIIAIPGNAISASIDSVDGFKINMGTSEVSIDPGPHKIQVTCHVIGSDHTQVLDVSIVAAGHYKLYTRLEERPDICSTRILLSKEKA